MLMVEFGEVAVKPAAGEVAVKPAAKENFTGGLNGWNLPL